MPPVHLQVLEAAASNADSRWIFRVSDLIAALPHLNPATVRTHVASRCCLGAPAHHASRYPYFRSIGRGVYRIEPPYRRRPRRSARSTGRAWQDKLLEAFDSGVDSTLIAEALTWTPTERLERMRAVANALDDARHR